VNRGVTSFENSRIDFAALSPGRSKVGFVPDFVSDPDANEGVRKALVVSPEMREFIAKYVEDGPKLN
jgi:hypothetical protein